MDWYNSDDDNLSMNSDNSDTSQNPNPRSHDSPHNLSLDQANTAQQVYELTQEHITCQICCKYALNAVICENDKCQKLFCLACASSTKKTVEDRCPFCRCNPFEYYSSPYSEVINKMELVCTLCKEKYLLQSELKHYKIDCSFFQTIECNYCHQKLKKEDLVKHTKMEHFDKIDEIIESLYSQPRPEYNSELLLSKNKLYLQKIGRKPKLGTSGKYYCGGKLQTKCVCCNGYCGPTNGQNCAECMKLDLKRFGVPKGYLVNASGNVCRKKGEDFICEVMLNNKKESCVQGSPCRACTNVKKNIKRYQHLI